MSVNYVMMVDLVTLLICFSLSLGDANVLPRHNHLIAKSNCNESCGSVNIPFPFGVNRDCSLHDQFVVTCNYSSQPPRLFFSNTSIEITSISLSGQLNVLQYISRDCYNDGINTENNTPWITVARLLSVNYTVNKFIAVGCDTYAIVQGYYSKYNPERSDSYITGCMSMCSSSTIDAAGNNGDNNNSCSGVGCCQTSIPNGAWNVTVTLSSYYNHTKVKNKSSCSYAFVVEESSFRFSKDYLSSLESTSVLPIVLDWAVGNETCEIARNSTAYACKSNNSYCRDNSNGYRCSCVQGYDGNPYLEDGCQDIDECKISDYRCAKDAICTNTNGNYTCTCLPGFSGNGVECNPDNPQRKIPNIYLVIGVTAGAVVLVIIVCGWLYTGFQRRKMLMMKKKFFQENGGLFLQQRLTREEGSSNTNTIKIFTAEELERATNDFDKDRVVGQGGYGTVYKGYLKDNRSVAIKKSKVIDRNQIEQFINEVIVLSQINHRNVVKLLGCCLETEVPLLVYEFISNGTVYEHLHDKVKASTLSLDIRLRVAAETAGVLSYLHSAAYPPIIHRDIKSVNILLDKTYTAKVSDFGASRLVPTDQTELSTLVQGTLGYLDPEYLQTNQLTEKSDVYSFGVVLVELLTGKKALCFERPEEERSLAQYFISSVEKGYLFDILDENIVWDERNRGQLKNAAMLAQRCLSVKGDDRPTMKEVAADLEAESTLKHSWAQTDQNSEEMEFLLQGIKTSEFGYEYSEDSIQIDSITSHITPPLPGGR